MYILVCLKKINLCDNCVITLFFMRISMIIHKNEMEKLIS